MIRFRSNPLEHRDQSWGESDKAVNMVITHLQDFACQTFIILNIYDGLNVLNFWNRPFISNFKQNCLFMVSRAAITYHDIVAFHKKLSVKRPWNLKRLCNFPCGGLHLEVGKEKKKNDKTLRTHNSGSNLCACRGGRETSVTVEGLRAPSPAPDGMLRGRNYGKQTRKKLDKLGSIRRRRQRAACRLIKEKGPILNSKCSMSNEF